MFRHAGPSIKVGIGRHHTLSLQPGKSGFVRHNDRLSVMNILSDAKSDSMAMMKIRRAISGPLSHLSDDEVLGTVATEIDRRRMVLTSDFLDHRSDTASGKGMTTTIHRADDSTEIRTGNRPWRNYNPGDLQILPKDKNPFAVRHGSIGKEGVFAIFPNEKSGFAALTALLLIDKYQGMSILDTMKTFAPASDHNDPKGYATMLSKAVSAPVTTSLSALTSSQLGLLVNKIAEVEGYYHAGMVRILPARPR